MSRERPRRTVLPPAQEHIEKLDKVINEGNCYGAQQMYTSISARYVSAERYSEGLDILESGALLQLKHDQVTCGAELANMFVDTLVKGKFPYSDDICDRLRKIYEAFPRKAVPNQIEVVDDADMQKLAEELGAANVRVQGCSSFLKTAIRWSIEFGTNKNGSPQLHVMLAEYMYFECPEVDILKTSYHFARGNSPEKFATIIVNFMEKCYPGEDDLAIARAVLMYLALGNLRDANRLLEEVKNQVESTDGIEYPKSDLMQFVNFVLQILLKREGLPLFRVLMRNYQSSIDRDPTFDELLDMIAEKFYGVRPQDPMQGMLISDIFKMMGAADMTQ